MINLGIIDLVLILIVIGAYAVARRQRGMLPFYIVLVLVIVLEAERFAPGTLKTVGDAIRGIDAVNARLP
ncbi:MAG: hypothetical protein ABI874_10025, partial [Chloroflexota bacterium]